MTESQKNAPVRRRTGMVGIKRVNFKGILFGKVSDVDTSIIYFPKG
ncbi:hypothetical protein [Gilliamella sp. Nev3-1]|nr:hypothetical protein [Gilliamella apicola]